jgi:hypothetical protein
MEGIEITGQLLLSVQQRLLSMESWYFNFILNLQKDTTSRINTSFLSFA